MGRKKTVSYVCLPEGRVAKLYAERIERGESPQELKHQPVAFKAEMEQPTSSKLRPWAVRRLLKLSNSPQFSPFPPFPAFPALPSFPAFPFPFPPFPPPDMRSRRGLLEDSVGASEFPVTRSKRGVFEDPPPFSTERRLRRSKILGLPEGDEAVPPLPIF